MKNFQDLSRKVVTAIGPPYRDKAEARQERKQKTAGRLLQESRREESQTCLGGNANRGTWTGLRHIYITYDWGRKSKYGNNNRVSDQLE